MSRLRAVAVALALVAIAVGVAAAQGARSTARDATASGEHFPPSPEVRAMLRAVSPAEERRWDLALVGFKTRNTLSAQHNPNRGIGAARDYIFRQFKQIAATSGGRMTVRLQSFVQPPVAGELPRATRITNVVANSVRLPAVSISGMYHMPSTSCAGGPVTPNWVPNAIMCPSRTHMPV